MEEKISVREVLSVYWKLIKEEPYTSCPKLFVCVGPVLMSIYALIFFGLAMFLPFFLLIVGYVLRFFWKLGKVGVSEERRKTGCCVCCGYDLRGCVEPRCPECGNPFVLANRPASV